MNNTPQDYDVIARPRPDGQYNIVERLGMKDRHLEGPLTKTAAETRALHLADERGGEAWLELRPGVYRLL